MRRIRILIGTLGVLLLCAPALRAQQAQRLLKSDIVRLLTSGTYSRDEVRTIIQRSCLTFEVTDKDLSDFRELGAGDDVIRAIQECDRRNPPPAGGQPATPARPTGPVSVSLALDSVQVPPADTVRVPFTVRRGGAPAAGVRLRLAGSGEVFGGEGGDVEATSDAAGRASFRIFSGYRATSYEFPVVAEGATLASGTRLRMSVVPGSVDSVALRPASAEIGAQDSSVQVAVTAMDRFGNPVPGTEIEIRRGRGRDASLVARDTTGGEGSAVLSLTRRAAGGNATLDVRAGGRSLARLPLRVAAARQAARQPAPTPASPADSAAKLATAARARLKAGDATAAVRLFEAALQQDSDNASALVGVGRARLAAGQTEQAVEWLDAATRRHPNLAEAWAGLGDAYFARDRRSAAQKAYRQALRLDPNQVDARSGLQRIGYRSPPPPLELSAWGGETVPFHLQARPAGPRAARLAVHPSDAVEIWGRYDDGLLLEQPWLSRGVVDFLSFYGGLGVDYGETEQFRTRIEVGHRRQPPADIGETVFSLEQTVRLGNGLGAAFSRPFLRVGGLLGHWPDRTDYLGHLGFGIPAGRRVRVLPTLSYGETIGSIDSGVRTPGREVRGMLELEIWPKGGVRITPGVAYGHVQSDLPSLEGGLFDGHVRLSVPITEGLRWEGYVHYQDPPAGPSFTIFGLGLSYHMTR